MNKLKTDTQLPQTIVSSSIFGNLDKCFEDLQNYEMASGDSVTVLITKADGFRYQILNHSS